MSAPTFPTIVQTVIDTTHARPAAVRQKGTADYDLAKALVEELPGAVIVSGGMEGAEHIRWVFEHTGCAAVMLARGALGNPWLFAQVLGERSEEPSAEEVLEEDHYGLEDVKDRVLEFLAVQQRVRRMKGPILCLVGPPGVGKTSLGQSIARATNRRFNRVSLGGVRDEAEIRGHRRTYIGSMPGKIIQKLSKVGTRNPLFLLDEIDKMSMDFRGDPSSALLEVLDPEQNHAFNDHYLEVDFDLSEVLFIATANSLNIPPPLRDRMEIIHLPGYTEEEKMAIARRYLVTKQMKANGLKKGELEITEDAIAGIIRVYTREAGVRNLEREIEKSCRKAVKQMLLHKKDETQVSVTPRNLDKFLGVRRFRYGKAEDENRVGQVTGLAWTEVGGELLSIEALRLNKGANAAELIRDGEFHRNSDLPVNPSGGATCGSPISSTGLIRVVEAVAQLRGEAGQRQIEIRTPRAAVSAIAGSFQTHEVGVLEA